MIKTIISISLIRLLGASAAFGFTFIILKIMDSHSAGLFFIAQSALMFGCTILRFGLDDTLIRFVSKKNRYNQSEIVTNALLLSIPISLIVSLLIFSLSENISIYIFNDSEINENIINFAFCIPFLNIIIIYSCYLQGLKRIGLSIFIRSSSFYILSLLLMSIIKFYFNIGISISYLYMVSIIIIGIISLYKLRGFINLKHLKIHDEHMVSFKNNWMSSIILQFNIWGVITLLGMILPPDEVAPATLILRITLMISFVAFAINLISAPSISYLQESFNAEEKIQIYIKTKIRSLLLIAIPFTVLIFVFSSEILSFFDENFVIYENILQVFIVSQFILITSGNSNYILMMTGHEHTAKIILLITSLIFVSGIFYFTITFGLIGFAYAYLINCFSITILTGYFINRKLNINIFRYT